MTRTGMEAAVRTPRVLILVAVALVLAAPWASALVEDPVRTKSGPEVQREAPSVDVATPRCDRSTTGTLDCYVGGRVEVVLPLEVLEGVGAGVQVGPSTLDDLPDAPAPADEHADGLADAVTHVQVSSDDARDVVRVLPDVQAPSWSDPPASFALDRYVPYPSGALPAPTDAPLLPSDLVDDLVRTELVPPPDDDGDGGDDRSLDPIEIRLRLGSMEASVHGPVRTLAADDPGPVGPGAVDLHDGDAHPVPPRAQDRQPTAPPDRGLDVTYEDDDGRVRGASTQRIAAVGTGSALHHPGAVLAAVGGTGGLLALAVLAYRHLQRKAVLDNDVRRDIYEHLEDDAGATIADAADAVDVSHSTARYHVQVLEDHGLVRTEDVRNRRHLFRTDCGLTDEERTLRCLERNERTQEIWELLHARDGWTLSDLADELGISKPGVSWHLRRMEEHGLVHRSGPQRHRVYHAEDVATHA